jgi:hypothetical protein
MNKRARQDSAGPFLSRVTAADIRDGEIERPGGFIEGRIYSTNPRKNQYTIDVRPNLKAKAVYLDVAIEDKLQRRLGELLCWRSSANTTARRSYSTVLRFSCAPARYLSIQRWYNSTAHVESGPSRRKGEIAFSSA